VTTSVSKSQAGETRVAGVKLHQMPIVDDLRGMLSFGEVENHLPFAPKRYFIVYGVPSKEVRGEHAHRELHQFLVCVQGSVSVVIDDGSSRDEVLLDSPGLGLHIPPLVWGIQYRYSLNAVLLVLASDTYKAEDYIRDYDEFLSVVKS
jgi:dTDP-4-dehydrorhamnose 3,5-epimerase-like enzyme